MASMCEKKIIQMRPGINHLRAMPRSGPECSQEPRKPEKKAIRRMNMMLMEALINKEEEAMVVFSASSSVVLT